MEVEEPLSKFYLLAKVHKEPLKTRPIISCSGSILHGIGRWLDVQLTEICNDLDYVCTSSITFVEELKALKPTNEWYQFTCDAESMYTNIETRHALEEISAFLSKLDYAINTVSIKTLF